MTDFTDLIEWYFDHPDLDMGDFGSFAEWFDAVIDKFPPQNFSAWESNSQQNFRKQTKAEFNFRIQKKQRRIIDFIKPKLIKKAESLGFSKTKADKVFDGSVKRAAGKKMTADESKVVSSFVIQRAKEIKQTENIKWKTAMKRAWAEAKA